jgi:hypothetical protein
MATASERDIAFSMMRLWGRDAENLAIKYAQDFEHLNNFTEADRWHAVQRIVARWDGLVASSSKASAIAILGLLQRPHQTPAASFRRLEE